MDKDKEDAAKNSGNRNFENFAQKLKALSGSFTKTNLRKVAAITVKVC